MIPVTPEIPAEALARIAYLAMVLQTLPTRQLRFQFGGGSDV